jgi:hypothetical protein
VWIWLKSLIVCLSGWYEPCAVNLKTLWHRNSPNLVYCFSMRTVQRTTHSGTRTLVNIRGSTAINQLQFIYFMHLMMSRRRGRTLPVGIPLEIKEEFLKSVNRLAFFGRDGRLTRLFHSLRRILDRMFVRIRMQEILVQWQTKMRMNSETN